MSTVEMNESKSAGIRKRKSIFTKKAKYNKKRFVVKNGVAEKIKRGYENIRCNFPGSNKRIRRQYRSDLSYSIKNNNVDEFIMPLTGKKNEMNWWDCGQYKLKIFSFR